MRNPLYFTGGGGTAFPVPDHGYGPAHGPKESTTEIRIMGHVLFESTIVGSGSWSIVHKSAQIKIMAHRPDHIQNV